MTSEREGKTDLLGGDSPFVVTMMLAGVMLLAGVASNVEGTTHVG